MSRLAEIEADAHARGVDVRSLPSADRRALVIAAAAIPLLPMPLPTPAQRAATAAAEVPADADGPHHVGGRFIRDLLLADRERDRLAHHRQLEEERRRRELAAFPSLLEDVREGMDAVVAPDAAEELAE